MKKKIITGSPVKIKDCKPGDIISVTAKHELDANTYLNIVVQPSITVEMLKYADMILDMAFNVISLNDGRPRTFHPESEVYRFNREDVFGKQ